MTYDMVLRYLVPFIVVGSNVTWWFQLSICFLEVENENQNQNKVHVEPTWQWHERNWIWVQLRLLKERRRWTCLWFTKCSSSGCPKLGNLDYRKSIFENDQALCRIQGNYAGPTASFPAKISAEYSVGDLQKGHVLLRMIPERFLVYRGSNMFLSLSHEESS